MAKRKKKNKVPKARDLIVLDMILGKMGKGGTHKDKKRESKDNPPIDDG